MSSAYKNILQLDGVSFSYTGEDFIKGLKLSVGEGEFIGLLGPNGSGKSTMLKLLAGILRPQAGVATLWNRPLYAYRNRDRAKLVSYLPQLLDMNLPFRVEELVRMGFYPYEKEPVMGLGEALGMVGLEDKSNVLLTHLSGGERRRAFIAMTLLQGAGILLLDEPLANLDIRFQMELIRLLKELNRKRNISIVMALHDINLAFRFERLILVKDGSVLSKGVPDEVLRESFLKEAFEMDFEVKRDGSNSYISCAE
jgi:iron complex transport system ATP-binding protein